MARHRDEQGKERERSHTGASKLGPTALGGAGGYIGGEVGQHFGHNQHIPPIGGDVGGAIGAGLGEAAGIFAIPLIGMIFRARRARRERREAQELARRALRLAKPRTTDEILKQFLGSDKGMTPPPAP